MTTTYVRRLALVSFALCLLVASSAAWGQHADGTLTTDPSRLSGTDAAGNIKIFAPNPNQSGSSVSHWDILTEPDLLMEPFATGSFVSPDVDLTDELFTDIGYTLGAGSPIGFVNGDGAGVGFNDPTVVAPVGGNPGVTLGDQRQFVFTTAATVWSGIIGSTGPIDIFGLYSVSLPCGGGGAVLGAAGALWVNRDYAGAPQPGTWTSGAESNAITGVDAVPGPGGEEIIAFFNPDIDTGCLPGVSWYYGVDNNPPPGQIDLFEVLMHEIAHGLGFQTFTDDATGEEFLGFPSIYDHFLLDNPTGMHWPALGDAGRAASAISDDLVWDGANVVGEAPNLLSDHPAVEITSPSTIAGTYYGAGADFGPPVGMPDVSGSIACALDNVGTTTDGCEPIVNSEVAGRIALIDRGTCAFTQKVANAQAAGAVGAIIVNSLPGNTLHLGLGGTDPSITIPSIMLGNDDGNAIRAAACASILEVPTMTLGGLAMLAGLMMLAAFVMLRRRMSFGVES